MNQLNYASLEASRKLVESGIVLKTEAYWVLSGSSYDKNWTWDLSATSRRDYLDPNDYFIKEFYPACSMAEVWRELPEEIYQGVKTSYHLELIKVEKTNRCTYRAITCSTLGYMPENTNPTDALIDLLIWIKKKEV